MRRTLICSVLAAGLAACDAGPGKITFEDAAVVTGVAYIDRDGDGRMTVADAPVPGIAAALLLQATGDTIARATTRQDGTFSMTGVPAGRYRLVAHRGTAGDTLDVLQIDSAQITLAAGDTLTRQIRVGYPLFSVQAARGLPAGRRVTVEGVALNSWSAFGDSTVHLRDATGSIRSVGVVGSVLAGDSIRVLATTGSRNGQPVLAAATAARIVAGVGLEAPDSISTQRAASADGGARDAAQVRVGGLITGSQTLQTGDALLTINDGSGSLDVLFDKDVTFATGAYVPGALLNVAGVLVPTGTGAWQLKPRSAADAAASYPSVTIQQARTLDAGRIVYITGVALNGWVTFGDQTVHVQDPTGALRVIQLPSASIFTGDSIRVLGTLSVRNGQPVLIGSSSAVLLAGVGIGTPDTVSTHTASTAANGVRDAGQVAVSGRITAISTDANGDLLLTIVDSSQTELVVRLDADVGFPTGAYAVDNTIRARGVLVPDATGTRWQLKPRTLNEIAVTG
jgi:hypothetical protein